MGKELVKAIGDFPVEESLQVLLVGTSEGIHLAIYRGWIPWYERYAVYLIVGLTLLGSVILYGVIRVSVAPRQLETRYPIWSEQILKTLQQQNRVDSRQFPRVHREDIRAKFTGEHPRLNLTYRSERKTLQITEATRIGEFTEQWEMAQKSITKTDAEDFRSATEQITRLFCRNLGFKPLDALDSFAQLFGQMLDASNPGFRLNIRPQFPIVYSCKEDFSNEDITNISGLLHNLGVQSDYFALLVACENSELLRKIVNETPYRYDFIVLSRNQLWEILTDKEPIRRLTELILEQVDLTRVSPFVTGGPVPEKMFFGRAEEEKTLLQSISQSDFAIVANRRVGKTSLLNRFYAKITKDPKYQSFYFDLQNVFNYADFYIALRQRNEQFAAELSKMEAPLSPQDFYDLALRIKKQNNNRQLVFIFDEVDELLAYDVGQKEALFRTFRGLSQSEYVRFVFSGTTTLVKRVQDSNSPLFNFGEQIRLGRLDRDAAEALITTPMQEMGITFEDKENLVNHVFDLSACHPNMVQYVGDRLIKQINKKGSRSITGEDLEAVVNSREFYEYFEKLLWGQASHLEKLIVYLMWDRPSFNEAELFNEMARRSLPTEKVKESLETLQIYTVLTQENDSYYFTFREFGQLKRKFVISYKKIFPKLLRH